MTSRLATPVLVLVLAFGASRASAEPKRVAIVSGQGAAEGLASELDKPGYGPWYEKLAGSARRSILAIARAPQGESLQVGGETSFFELRSKGKTVSITSSPRGTDATLTGEGLGAVRIAPGGATTVEAYSTRSPYAFAKARPLTVFGKPAALVWEHSVSPTEPKGNFSRTRLYVGPKASWSVPVPLRLGKAILGRGR